MPKISTIVCIYNAEKYINKCVDSIFAQTFSDFELILVDDGSTDSSPKICDEIALRDIRVKVSHIQNRGLSAARNHGLSLASGEFIVFSDADDYIDNTAYEKMYNAAIKNNSDIVFCGYHSDREKDGKLLSSQDISSNYAVLTDKESFLKKFVEIKTNYVFDASWNKLYKASIIRENTVTMPVGEIFEDTEFVLRFLEFTSNITILPDCFYHYMQRMNGASITKKYNHEKLDCLKKRCRSIIAFATIDGTVDDEILSFAALFYIKSVYSFFADLFFPASKPPRKTIRGIINSELSNPDFNRSLAMVSASGFANKLTVFVAKTKNITLSYIYSKFVYLLKFKMQSVFSKLKNR